MLLDDEHIKVSELLEIVKKGDQKSIAEQNKLNMDLKMLSECSVIYDASQKRNVRLTMDQQMFVKNVLGSFVCLNMPKLAEVMHVYDLGTDTIFVWMDYGSGCGDAYSW